MLRLSDFVCKTTSLQITKLEYRNVLTVICLEYREFYYKQEKTPLRLGSYLKIEIDACQHKLLNMFVFGLGNILKEFQRHMLVLSLQKHVLTTFTCTFMLLSYL